MTDRKSFPRALILVLGVILLVLAFVLGFASMASATQPNPEHKVTICHATPPDTAAGGFVAITVDVASVGFQQSGHQNQHDADIIPTYSYTDVNGVKFSYPGKNLDTLFFGSTGLTILNNGCILLDQGTPTPTPSESLQDSPSATPNPDLPSGAMGDGGSTLPILVFMAFMTVGFGGLVLTEILGRRR